MNLEDIRARIDTAVAEDVGSGDVTTLGLFDENTPVLGRFVVRQRGVIAGLPIAEIVFERVAEKLLQLGHVSKESLTGVGLSAMVCEGEMVEPSTVIATVRGPARVVLTGERLSLNFLQHLSGIATVTRRFVEAVGEHTAVIMDTRKTTPGWRDIEKYAVRTGGGVNHRMGLFDMVLIKDNHLRLKGGEVDAEELQKSVAAVRRTYPGLQVEVEATTLAEVRAATEAKADIIMLDNMTAADISEAVRMVEAAGKQRPLTEASGGITLDNVAAVARTGVDRISIGAITHSAPALDISLEVERGD